MSTRAALRLRWMLAFAAGYAILAVLSRMTVADGQAVSLVWPGSGLAVLWLLAEAPRRQAYVLVPLATIHAAVAWLTGAPDVICVMGAVSVTCQTWATVALLRRWCPMLLGVGGTESLRSPRTLVHACGAAALGSALGAVLGTVGVYGYGRGWDDLVLLAWFGRHVTGVVVVGFVGHLAWEWRTSGVPPRARGGSRRELAALVAVSTVVVCTIFVQPLPLVFLVIPLAVWSAIRFSTFMAALHALALGGASLMFTVAGLGPAVSLPGEVDQALVGQVFLVTVLLTGLAVGAISDRIDELVVHMGQARARAAEQAELLAEMTESMAEGLLVLDGEGRIERSNGACSRLAHRVRPGVPDEQALAELAALVLHPATAEGSASRAELGVGDVQLTLASGEEMVLAVSRAVLHSQRSDDGGSSVLLVLQEVTEHRQGMRPLVSFASTAAHDLRGPLTAIRSWLELAASDLDPRSDAAMSVDRAGRASRQMAGLIDDLLAQAVAEAGELVPRDVPLGGPGGALEQAMALLGPDDVLEVPDGLPSVNADEVALRQVLANLVGNAVKYARPGVPARVRVSAQRQGSRVVVDVEDNGLGVEDHERTLIFERFRRGDAVGPGSRGSGMGLSMCQTIVQRHGGSIECLPAPTGPGSLFRFDLPAAAAEPVGVLPVPSAPPAAEVDDELATA